MLNAEILRRWTDEVKLVNSHINPISNCLTNLSRTQAHTDTHRYIDNMKKKSNFISKHFDTKKWHTRVERT